MMSEANDYPRLSQPGFYEIQLVGLLDPGWRKYFPGMRLHADPRSGLSILRGQVADQAALHSVLRQVRDLGLPLFSIQYRSRGMSLTPETG